MNRFLLCLFFFFPLVLSAQAPVLTFDEFHQQDRSTDYLLVIDTLDTKQNQQKGEDVTWDFRHLSYFETLRAMYTHTSRKSFIDTMALSNITIPKTTDYIFRTRFYSDILEREELLFLKKDSQTFQLLFPDDKFKWGNNSIDLNKVASEALNPIAYFHNDLQYGEVKKDSVLITFDSIRADGLAAIKLIYLINYDGFGKMLLPNGETLDEVIKIQQQKNTVFYFQNPQGDTLITSTATDYLWFAKGQSGEIISTNQSVYYFRPPVYQPISIKPICKEKVGVSFKALDGVYQATLEARDLIDSTGILEFPIDSFTFRLANSFNLHSSSNPTITQLINRSSDSLAFGCEDLVGRNYANLFVIDQKNKKWGQCYSEIFLIDELDDCLSDELTKICVSQPDGTPVDNILIDWSYGTSLITNATFQNGCIFTEIDTTQTINLLKVDEYDLGVSSFDLLIIRKHILGIDTFKNEAQFLAADINNNGTITSKDLLELRKIILGRNNLFPGNTSWRFFPKHWLEEGFDWRNLKIGHNLRFDPKIFEERRYEFIAIKVGDVSSIPVH